MHPRQSPASLAWVTQDIPFPPTWQAWGSEDGANGLLAASQGISVRLLITAYRQGIFPWSNPSEPVLWWTPDPRMVLQTGNFRRHRSLRQAARRFEAAGARICMNAEGLAGFPEVMRACAAPRPDQPGTWITPAIIEAYTELHRQGMAHSVVLVDADGQLLGGLYCVAIGGMVYGESMFSRATDASKICLAALVAWVQPQGVDWIDCQQQTGHLARLGAAPMPRADFERGIYDRTRRPALLWTSRTLPWSLLHG